LSKVENGNLPFSRRLTLKEIWRNLDKKYPASNQIIFKESIKKA
jgi:hypothetical protein